jgi:hypothetical protein
MHRKPANRVYTVQRASKTADQQTEIEIERRSNRKNYVHGTKQFSLLKYYFVSFIMMIQS